MEHAIGDAVRLRNGSGLLGLLESCDEACAARPDHEVTQRQGA